MLRSLLKVLSMLHTNFSPWYSVIGLRSLQVGSLIFVVEFGVSHSCSCLQHHVHVYICGSVKTEVRTGQGLGLVPWLQQQRATRCGRVAAQVWSWCWFVLVLVFKTGGLQAVCW